MQIKRSYCEIFLGDCVHTKNSIIVIIKMFNVILATYSYYLYFSNCFLLKKNYLIRFLLKRMTPRQFKRYINFVYRVLNNIFNATGTEERVHLLRENWFVVRLVNFIHYNIIFSKIYILLLLCVCLKRCRLYASYKHRMKTCKLYKINQFRRRCF